MFWGKALLAQEGFLVSRMCEDWDDPSASRHYRLMGWMVMLIMPNGSCPSFHGCG
jgi:hypothetical protein